MTIILKPLYFSTIFLSAFLLFLVQPMLAKMILPWFGGSSSVWITCVLFFQIMLFAGYSYAHGSTVRLSGKAQASFHGILIFISLLFLPVIPSFGVGIINDNPALSIMILLLITVGLPYFLLSATSPLLQAWYAKTYSRTLPYRLFAVSNLASLLSLLSYPFLIEPFFTLQEQATAWSLAYTLFATLCIALSVVTTRLLNISIAADPSGLQPTDSLGVTAAPQWKHKITWLLLSACSSILLLSVTDHLSQNIAAIPLLWIVPLGLYLLSFTICFERDGWYNSASYFWIVFAALVAMSYGIGKWGVGSDIRLVIAVYCISLFFCCMFCHGELARRKPAPGHLTSFYLYISAGGAIGSFFVVLVAPLVFSIYIELPIGMLLCALLLLLTNFKKWWVTDVVCVALIVRLVVIAFSYADYYTNAEGVRTLVRNFYGHQRVIDKVTASGEPYRSLVHGTISHGIQFLSPDKQSLPTAYFARTSGIGLASAILPESSRRIGIIGLGAGTIASYARAGDHFTFFEINPQVEQIARNDFSFLANNRGTVDVKIGDGRLLIEKEAPHQFDLIVIDAFSGDSIPVHLLTVEALELYFSKIKSGGIVAFHVSNLYLELSPILENAAKTLGKYSVVIVNQEDVGQNVYQAEWVLMSSNRVLLESSTLLPHIAKTSPRPHLRVWTDQYSNLFQVLN